MLDPGYMRIRMAEGGGEEWWAENGVDLQAIVQTIEALR
jgi:hypothetical protein